MSTDRDSIVAGRVGPVDERGWGCGRILGGLLLAAVLCLVAMVAVVNCLKRPTSVNEAHAISDLRTVISGQAAWQSANGGYYEGDLSCLASPSVCMLATGEDRPANANDPPIE